MFLLVFWSAILYEASWAWPWGVKVCTTEKETCDDQDFSKVEQFIKKERIPIYYIAVTNPDGDPVNSPSWLNDNLTSVPVNPNIKYERFEKVFIVMVELGREDKKDAPVYVSKIRLNSCDGSNVQPDRSSLNGFKKDDENQGYWILDPPALLYNFTVSITMNEGDKDKFHEAICEIEVLKPSLYGKRVQLPEEKDNNNNWDDSNMTVVVENCRKLNASLSTTIDLDDNEKTWIGLFEKKSPRTDDGAYNTVSTVLKSIKARVCDEYNGNTHCENAACSATEVEYYVRENSSDGNLRKVCESERGIPVSPSSGMEIRFLRQQFPDNNLIVAACEDKGYQYEPTVIREKDTFDCKKATPVVLSTDGVLENFHHRNHNSALVACKRLSEKRRIGTNETGKRTISYLTQPKGILFDNDLTTAYTSHLGDSNSITMSPMEGLVWNDILELRLYTKYNEQYENGYAVIKKTARCGNESEVLMDEVLSMSKRDSYKFHQLEGTNCAANGLTSLKIEWPKQVELTEIQLINSTNKLEITVAYDALLRKNRGITLLCTAVNVTYTNLTWYLKGEEKEGRSYATEKGWTCALEVDEPELYTCESGEEKVNKYVDWAKTCDTADLQEPEHGYIVHNSLVKLGHIADIRCDEGFSYKNNVVCGVEGVFGEPESGDICVSVMGGLLDEIINQIDDANIEPQKITKDILDVVKENEFMFASEIDSSINLLKKVTTRSFQDNRALANIFEASNTISRKRVHGNKNITQVQGCLDVIDLIGGNVEVDPSSVFKLAGEGLALTAVDVPNQMENDITFALYNKTTIDDLQYFDWDVDLEGVANSISIPISQAGAYGRVWFTVYNESTYKAEKVASYIIGVTFGTTQTLQNFTANITLKKLYYGPRDATCMYWDKDEQDWSNKGLTKIKETDEYVVCQTNHFTSFSILMTRDDSFIPKIHKSVLEIISMAGCAVSCICLIMTIICLARFSHIRKLTDSIIHMNFSASLLCALLVFLIFIDFTAHPSFCKAVAMILHYFLLASVSWMFCEALHLYMSVQSIFTNNKHILLMAAIAWGCPFLMVTFTVLTDPSLESYTNPKCCWLSDSAMIYWFATPVLLLVTLNIVLYAMVLRYIARNAGSKKISCISDLRSCFLLLIVLGCTWIFGFFTLLTTKVAFQYLFAISNSLQGFCVFYCYCGSKQYIISAWRSTKEPQPLEEKEITMESKIVTQRDADEQQTQRTPSPSPSVATTQYATPYASTSIMRIPTMNNNWYMNDDHF